MHFRRMKGTAWLGLFASLLGSSPSRALAASNPPEVPIQARASRDLARQLLEQNQLDDALKAITQALAAAPQWADAYLTRYQINERRAGPDSSLAALRTPARGRDYERIAAALRDAADDLEVFIKLSPGVMGQQSLLSQLGELRLRQQAAEAIVQTAQEEARRRAEALRAQQEAQQEKARQAEEAARRQAEEQARHEEEQRKEAEQTRIAQQKQSALLEQRQTYEAKRADAAQFRLAGYITAGAGAAALAGGGLFAGLSQGEFSSAKNGSSPTSMDISSHFNRGNQYAYVADGLLVAGLAGVAVGASLIFANPDPGPFSVEVAIAPSSRSLLASVSFP